MSNCQKPIMGGRRKTRRSASRKSKKQAKSRKSGMSWTESVTKLYKEMKKSNPATQFRDALKAASKLKKQGKL